MKFSSKFSHSSPPPPCITLFSPRYFICRKKIFEIIITLYQRGEKKKEKKFKESLFFFEKQLENPSYPIPVELIIK